MATVTVHWMAAANADVNSDYKIYHDLAASGTFVLAATQDATESSTGIYTPPATTLVAAIGVDDESLELTDATAFADDDIIWIDREAILAGGKSGAVFGSCGRGQGSTVRREHAASAAVYKAHESKEFTSWDWGSRKAVRFRISHLTSAGESVAAEAIAVNPTMPPTNNLATIWGLLTDIQGNPKSGRKITLRIAQSDNYHYTTHETFLNETEEATTDADGYWEFFIPRDIDHAGGDRYTLTLDADSPATLFEWNIATVRDDNVVKYVETAART